MPNPAKQMWGTFFSSLSNQGKSGIIYTKIHFLIKNCKKSLEYQKYEEITALKSQMKAEIILGVRNAHFTHLMT